MADTLGSIMKWLKIGGVSESDSVTVRDVQSEF